MSIKTNRSKIWFDFNFSKLSYKDKPWILIKQKIDDFLKGEEDYYLRIIFNLPFNKNILETFYAQRINN